MGNLLKKSTLKIENHVQFTVTLRDFIKDFFKEYRACKPLIIVGLLVTTYKTCYQQQRSELQAISIMLTIFNTVAPSGGKFLSHCKCKCVSKNGQEWSQSFEL